MYSFKGLTVPRFIVGILINSCFQNRQSSSKYLLIILQKDSLIAYCPTILIQRLYSLKQVSFSCAWAQYISDFAQDGRAFGFRGSPSEPFNTCCSFYPVDQKEEKSIGTDSRFRRDVDSGTCEAFYKQKARRDYGDSDGNLS